MRVVRAFAVVNQIVSSYFLSFVISGQKTDAFEFSLMSCAKSFEYVLTKRFWYEAVFSEKNTAVQKEVAAEIPVIV